MPQLAPQNLWEIFQSVVQRNAEESALIFPTETVSFGKLFTLAEHAAQWLTNLGLKRGEVVALQLPKRLETYALWLACLRQGLLYVFIDPKNPVDRTTSILARTRPALYVSTSNSENPFGRHVRLQSGDVDGTAWIEALPVANVPALPAALHDQDPAYIMFTSGSTGEPKGAVIPHQGVMTLIRWACETVIGKERARFSNLNPLHFDNSVFDLFCGLMNGAALVPVETGALSNPMAWVRRLRDAHVSVVFAVPTLFLTLDRLKLLAPESLPDVRLFLFGGEGFPIEALKTFHARFSVQARLINVYGPTETSCICSSIEINAAQLETAGTGFASLGRMHKGFAHLVLDERGAPAEVGELWIGGPCVGLGYYANPNETAMRFLQDPRQDQYRSIWYRTGDIVREDDDGLLWFQGRVDNQVKIRGHRIELEEIDLVAEQMPDVLRASCVVVNGDDGPELRLAFMAERTISIQEMHAHCTDRLPAYMRPAHIRQLSQLPENANGKVDRKAVRGLLMEALT